MLSTMAADIEVVYAPDFSSNSCYAILGCDRSASPEQLRIAYRDLSRKYHPDCHPNNEGAQHTFQRIFVAYSTILESPSSEENLPFDDDAMRNVTRNDAKKAYETEFGEFRDRYYSKGAIIGLPYSYQLRESLERSKCIREAFSFTICCIQFSFFRSWLIKKDLGALFLLLEMLCTWGAIIIAVWNFMLEEFPDALDEIPYVRDLNVEEIPHVSIIGGVAVLIGNFIQCFWYGFTRHPIIINESYGIWLMDGKTSPGGEISDIQDTCSSFFHSDSYRRSQLFTLFACTPLLAVDHIASILASAPVFLFYLCKTCQIRSQSRDAELAYQFSKSIGGLMSIVGYYLIWVLGGSYAKVGVAAALVANQHLYNAILFRKSFGGFLQSLLFGSIFAITIVHKPRKAIKSEDETATSDIEKGLAAGRFDPSNVLSETESDTQPRCPSDEVEDADADEPIKPDPDAFEVNFDGFYRVQSKLSVPPSVPPSGENGHTNNEMVDYRGRKVHTKPLPTWYRNDQMQSKSLITKTSSAPPVPPPLLPSDENGDTNSERVDYRGRKAHTKPLPTWYRDGQTILDTQNKAQDVDRTTSFKDMFHCATNTVEEKEEPIKINAAGSITSGRNTAVETTQSIKTENTETTDMIALARSAKRKIEAEFYARVFGSPTEGSTTPGSPEKRRDHTSRTSFGVGGEQERDTLSPESGYSSFPQKIEMEKQQDSEMNDPAVFTAMFDDSSGESSGDRKTDAMGDGGNETDFGFITMETVAMSTIGEDLPSGLQQNSPPPNNENAPPPNNEPPKELDDLLGPFVPFISCATTKPPTYSIGASHITGTSHRTRKKSNSKRTREESRDFIIHHHPDQGPSAYGEVGRNRSPRKSRTGSPDSVPELVIGAQGSADESEVTMDKRQFTKRTDGDNYFWQFMVNPTSSTLTRSVT